MRRFAEVLRAPHVTPLLVAVVLARLPIGLNGLAVLLYLRETTGSFATAGAVVGGLALGTGLSAPVLGRAVDRLGARRVLVPAAVGHGVLLGALVVAADADAPAAALVAIGTGVGFALPPTSAVLRSLWPRLLADRPHLLATGFALDTVMIEFVFIAGPLVAGALAATVGPEYALALSAACGVAGTIGFLRGPVRDEPSAARPASRFGALASPGIRTLVVTMLPVGAAFGALEVALPAFADAEGDAALGGLLIAVWSAGSLAGGLVYGARARTRPLEQIHLMLAAALPVGFLPVLLAPSIGIMALLVIPAGLCIAPLIATRNELVSGIAVEGARTESYTWPVTALTGGIALGSALAGSLAEHHGWREAAALGAGAAALGAILAFARQNSLKVPPAAPTT